MATTHILIIDDDAQARSALVVLLCGRGYNVSTAGDAAGAWALLEQQEFDLILAETQLPGVGQPSVLSALDELARRPAVILLTGRPSLESAIEAVNARADGYLIKPCEPQALLGCIDAALARRSSEQRPLQILQDIAAQLGGLMGQITSVAGSASVAAPRQDGGAEEGVLRIGGLQIGANRRAVMIGRTLLPVTPIEHKLLRCLAEANGEIRSYNTLVERIHGYHASNEEAAALLKSHARNLRRKLPPGYLVTVRDTGYMLVDPATQQSAAEEIVQPPRFLELGGVMPSRSSMAGG